MGTNLLITLLIVTLGAIACYSFAGSFLIYALTLLIGAVIIYRTKMNHGVRKENLNIIRDEERLYFYLSDDLLFSVELLQNKNLKNLIKENIEREMSTIKEITRKICFINFKDDNLLKELNSELNKS